jgi:hypothetical protein
MNKAAMLERGEKKDIQERRKVSDELRGGGSTSSIYSNSDCGVRSIWVNGLGLTGYDVIHEMPFG